MYLEHFRLNLKPFQIDTDQRFLYLSEQHQEALAVLRYGILFNRGILVLTGDVGTGKTILIRTLVETLGPDIHTAVLSDPSLRGLDFFNFMASAIGMEANFKTRGEFLISFGNFLDSLFASDHKALLILDEAQYIDPIQLEEIRILSDLERKDNQRLNIFFVGQNEFNSVIADNRLRALNQRISSHYHLEPLNLKEASDYVQHRLKVAGCHRPLFTPSALKKIYGLTKGYPRLINILCDLCLLTAFVKGLHEINPAMVEESAAELMHPSQLNEQKHSSSENKSRFDSALNADSQQSAAPKTLPVVATQRTQQLDPAEPPKPFALSLPSSLRKPAYLFAVVVLLPAIVWFNFKEDQSHGRQESSLSQTFNQGNQTKADVKRIQSSTTDKRLGEPQIEHVPKKEPAASAYKIPTEQLLMNTAAGPPDQFASPMVVPPTIRPEGIAPPPLRTPTNEPAVELPAEDSSQAVSQPENLLSQEPAISTHHDSPLKSTVETKANRSVDQSQSTTAVQHNVSNLKPLAEERPINTDPATQITRTNEFSSPVLRPDEIAASDEKAGAVIIVSNTPPLSVIPVTSEANSLPVPSAKKGGTETVVTEVASSRPATASTPVDAPGDIESDQAKKTDFGDVPSQSVSESDPSAIIDFVIIKRARQLGDQ